MGHAVPKLIRWDVNSKCNLSCKHCCVSENIHNDSVQDLTHKEFVTALRDMSSSGVEAVHFLGGEPTIRKDFLEILRIANECGLVVSFNTNGIRQDARYLDAIISYNVNKVVISLDGPDKGSHEKIRGLNTFERTLSFIKKLNTLRKESHQNRPFIQIQSVLTATWVNKVRDMVNLCVDLGVDSLKINHLAEFGDAASNLETISTDYADHFFALFDILDCTAEYPNLRIEAPIKPRVYQLHRRYSEVKLIPNPYSCPAINDNVYVDSSGDVSPCQLAHAQGMGKRVSTINIIQNKAEDIWDSEYFELFSQTVQKPDVNTLYQHQVPCNRCPFKGVACNPCPLPSDPNYYPTNYMCLIAEQLIEIEDAEKLELSRDRIKKEITHIIRNNPPRSSKRTACDLSV